MKAVLEADDRLPSGEGPRDLHRVLHRLRPAVHEERALLVAARRHPVQTLRQSDVRLVGGDRETDVREAVELAADRVHHARMAVAGVHNADSTAEIDQSVAVGVRDYGTLGVHHCDRGDGRHPAGHRRGATRRQRTTGRTGDLGLEMDDAGHAGLAWNGSRGEGVSGLTVSFNPIHCPRAPLVELPLSPRREVLRLHVGCRAVSGHARRGFRVRSTTSTDLFCRPAVDLPVTAGACNHSHLHLSERPRQPRRCPR